MGLRSCVSCVSWMYTVNAGETLETFHWESGTCQISFRRLRDSSHYTDRFSGPSAWSASSFVWWTVPAACSGGA